MKCSELPLFPFDTYPKEIIEFKYVKIKLFMFRGELNLENLQFYVKNIVIHNYLQLCFTVIN